jgi:hypothetical protein
MGKWFPTDHPSLGGDIAHRLLPVDLGKGQGGRLDGTLDEQTRPIAALRGAGDFSSVPEQIIAFGSNEALAGPIAAGDGGEGGINVKLKEGIADPGVDAFVTLGGAQGIPGMGGREAKSICPVGIMRHESSTCGPSHQGTQGSEALHIREPLKVPEGGGGLGPTIEAQDGLSALGGGVEKSSVEGHVEFGLAGSGIDEGPGFANWAWCGSGHGEVRNT